MFTVFQNIDEFNAFVKENEAVLAYFSTTECNVCKVLKPKVGYLFSSTFPKIKLCYVETNALPEIAAQNHIFSVPTIIIYFEGREFIRKSRSFGIDELKAEVARPYSLLFS
ncbi:MAG: thioredoxin family protein [Prolixibacteraceae bacterium]|nr:thioredoxin family protein [Prolixibacteraceae bacterium]